MMQKEAIGLEQNYCSANDNSPKSYHDLSYTYPGVVILTKPTYIYVCHKDGGLLLHSCNRISLAILCHLVGHSEGRKTCV